MTTPATSTAEAGRTSSGDGAGADAPVSNEPADTATGRGSSAAKSRPNSPALLFVLLLLTGVVAGGGISLVVNRPTLGPAAIDGPAAPPPRAITAPNPEPTYGESDPQPTPPQGSEPLTSRWRPGDNEVYPDAKRLASRVVERLTNFESGSPARRVAAEVGRRFNVAPSELVTAAQEVVRRGVASKGVVVYPQLGGVRPDSAAVMVVVDQTLDDGTKSWVERRTVDVRLVLREQRWALEQVESAGGKAVEQPARISDAALAVLEHPAIRLTDSARWDIYSGAIDDRLLTMMARAAERHEIAIVTLATGHPLNVFATDMTSNHTLGRAVDIYSVDGEDVVESRTKGSPAFRLARWLYNQGVPELGSPWAFDGYGGRSFTDIVHADHIHLAM